MTIVNCSASFATCTIVISALVEFKLLLLKKLAKVMQYQMFPCDCRKAVLQERT